MKNLLLAAFAWLFLCCAVNAQAIPGVGMGVPNTAIPLYYNSSNNASVYNRSSSGLNVYRGAIAAIKTGGTRPGPILFLGDSTFTGTGGGTGGTSNMNGAFANSPISQLATLLNATGPLTGLISHNSFFGNQNSNITYSTYDPRVTYGANWSFVQQSIGAFPFKYTSGAVNNLSFTPAGQFDTIKVYYIISPGNGSFTTNVDGGASLGTTTTAGTAAVGVQSYTVTKATHTINIVPNNDASFFILGIVTYDSTVKRFDFIQSGWIGAGTASYVANASPWNPLPMITTLAPSLCVINLTINDSNNSVSLSTFTTNMTTLITTCQSAGASVLLMVGVPSNTVQATNGTLDGFVAVLRSLALTYNVPLLDLKARWTSYAVTNAIMPYFDQDHPQAQGYSDVALAMYEMLATP